MAELELDMSLEETQNNHVKKDQRASENRAEREQVIRLDGSTLKADMATGNNIKCWG